MMCNWLYSCFIYDDHHSSQLYDYYYKLLNNMMTYEVLYYEYLLNIVLKCEENVASAFIVTVLQVRYWQIYVQQFTFSFVKIRVNLPVIKHFFRSFA